MRNFCLAAAAFLFSSSLGFSATVFSSVNGINSFFVPPIMPILDSDGATPLDNGDTGVNGDGDLMAFGVTDDSSITATPNWASFVAHSGVGSVNHTADPSLNTTMGDGDTVGFDGLFSTGISLNNDDHPNIPANGQLWVIRFYNGPTIESSTHYNTVSANNARWQANTTQNQPGTASSLDMDNNRTDLVWEGTPWQTSILNPDFVPEPSSALLALLGVGFLLRRRRS